MMKAWSKYSQVLNDPVRNLNMRLTFQNGDVTLIQSHHLSNVSWLIIIFTLICFTYLLILVMFHALGVGVRQRFHASADGLRR